MSDELFSVGDRVAVVSGSSRGIGLAIARALAQRGARVVISSSNNDRVQAAAGQLEADGLSVTPMVCDIGDPSAITRLVDRVVDTHQRIDILFNVAAVNKRGRVEDYTEDEYDRIMRINLKGAFQMCQAVGKRMIAQGGGKIVNISSINTSAPLRGVSVYAMAKVALDHMTRSMACEWAGHNVQVNALAPGFVLTELTQPLWDNPVMREWVLANTPGGRAGQPEDMVGTALFLASPASNWVTGQVIYVDGALTAGYHWPLEI